MSFIKNMPRLLATGLIFISALQVNAAEVSYDYARVVDVDPITKTVRVSQPREECWQEEVIHREPARHHQASSTGTILGGIVGAAIGNRLGHGKTNKKVGAVAGAVLGASIGHDMSRRAHASSTPARSYKTTEERCEIVRDYYEQEKITGYHVTYRYHGEVYETRTKVHPGKRIKLRVNISPVL